MKKTSLILAISALLYGTSGTYVIAQEAQEDWEGWTEGGPAPDGWNQIQGLEPFPELPIHVSVDSSDPLHLNGNMCEQSYQVTGNAMAEFPVEVTYINGGVEYTEQVLWQDNGGLRGLAQGTGWKLKQRGDTWFLNKPWTLTTDDVTTVNKIVLKPIERNTDGDETGDRRLYTFDIGSSVGVKPDDEHTPESARGRPIEIKTPPEVNFTATYSKPVYTKGHNEKYDPDEDGNNFSDGGTPTHDLYGVLTIEFSEPVNNAELEPAFRFVADTDCVLLEVTSASVSSSSGEVTLFGSGSVYIEETDSSGRISPLKYVTDVDEGGVKNIHITDLVDEFQPSYCYRLYTEKDSKSDEFKPIPLEIDDNMPKNQYCH